MRVLGACGGAEYRIGHLIVAKMPGDAGVDEKRARIGGNVRELGRRLPPSHDNSPNVKGPTVPLRYIIPRCGRVLSL